MTASWINGDAVCFVSTYVVNKGEAVEFVRHEHNGTIVFGSNNEKHSSSDWIPDRVKYLIEQHPRLEGIEHLPRGHMLTWSNETERFTLSALPKPGEEAAAREDEAEAAGAEDESGSAEDSES